MLLVNSFVQKLYNFLFKIGYHVMLILYIGFRVVIH